MLRSNALSTCHVGVSFEGCTWPSQTLFCRYTSQLCLIVRKVPGLCFFLVVEFLLLPWRPEALVLVHQTGLAPGGLGAVA